MSQTLKRILIVCMALAVVGVIVAGVYALMAKKPNTNTNTNNTVNTNSQGNQNTNNTTNTNGSINTNGETNTNAGGNTSTNNESSVLRLARIFVERYGTFSNRNNFENITTLEPFMTEAFQKESAQYISEQQDNGTPEEFYAITTTVASLEMKSFTADSDATVRVATRRVETKGDQDPTVFTQYMTVTFKNVSGNWKVSGAQWE